MPELIKMVEDIIGKRPAVKSAKKMGGAYGVSVRDKDGNWVGITLNADVAKEPVQAIRTLAHEIGHIMTK